MVYWEFLRLWQTGMRILRAIRKVCPMEQFIDISDCAEILSAMKDRIKNVEVYYNPYTTKLVSVIEEAKIYNIVTQKEV